MIKIISIGGLSAAFAIGKERKDEWKKLRGGRFYFGVYDNKCSEEAKRELLNRCNTIFFLKEEFKILKEEDEIKQNIYMQYLLDLIKEDEEDE